MKEGVSIIICCYNSELRLGATLQHAINQITDVNLAYEIVVVDNASTDGTGEIARSFLEENLRPGVSLIVISEPNPGLSYAKKKGISAARYEYLVFCDDDNWLDANYVQNTWNLFDLNSNVAVIGGCGTPQFEDPSKKPFWFEKLHHGYAVGNQADEESLVEGVYGAGMCARRCVLQKVMDIHPMFLTGRTSNNLTSGEDSEICARVKIAGYSILYSPKLKFKHFLPVRRLTWDYLKRLHIGLARSYVVLNLYKKASDSPAVQLPPFYWLKKGLYYWGIYFRYWPKHYNAYKKTEGTIEELHHIIWKNIAIDCFKYNFKTVSLYRNIINFKASLNKTD